MEEENQNPSEVVEEPTEETVEETSEETVEDQAEEAVDEAEESEDESAEDEEESEAADDKMITLKAVKACNLGKIERDGVMIHFVKGEEKEVKYDKPHKRIVDMYVEGGFLKVVKK